MSVDYSHRCLSGGRFSKWSTSFLSCADQLLLSLGGLEKVTVFLDVEGCDGGCEGDGVCDTSLFVSGSRGATVSRCLSPSLPSP